MQLESGKIIAIRTAVKPENGAKKPADQPCTSSKSDTVESKVDTDDDDIIMTSITYPDPKPVAPVNELAQRLNVPSTVPTGYTNGARRRGRPPTYNGKLNDFLFFFFALHNPLVLDIRMIIMTIRLQ